MLSSDEVVHRLIASDPDVRAALERRFGTTERARVAEVVFAEPEELAWLERLLHPRVRAEYTAWLERLDPAVDIAAVEVPLLYETGADALFDAVIVITAPEEVRRRRVDVDLERRSRRLIPDEEKAERADFSYVNVGTLDELDGFVVSVLERLGLSHDA